MPAFAPFRAYRYAPDIDLPNVIAPPYDVLSDSDIARLKALDPHNITHIDIPAGGDLSRPGLAFAAAEGDDPYARAAETFQAWIAESVLVLDELPSYTCYRMAFTDSSGAAREIVGVLGGLEVVDADTEHRPGSTTVLPHERITPKAVSDRLDLTRATSANLSPVWGLSLAEGLTAALAEPGEFVGELAVDGVTHRVERISDPDRIAAITAILAADDVLIADGHHRYSISRSYRDEVRAATGSSDSAAEYTLAFVNELVDGQLSIEAIHRLYSGVCLEHLRGVLSASFAIAPLDGKPGPQTLAQMAELGRLLLLHPDGQAEWLTPKDGAFPGVRDIDGALLEHALRPMAESESGAGLNVSYQHGLGEMLQAVGSGGYTAGVLIRPTSLDEIRRTARQRLLMPPKSTFFTPKLRTGLVIRPTGAAWPQTAN
ncbi:MAG: DUF1015 domain-containing protein [Propionibacteriaceae bacterium]|jgi:uncharacterized protein (DUF1015 family)|nr:DUF1015 domain-containing protein [Propionibacteriaceae bacterium]